MGAAPTEHEVVSGYDKGDKPVVTLADYSGELGLWAKDKTWIPEQVGVGAALKGWINSNERGSYFSIAQPDAQRQPQTSPNGNSQPPREDVVGRSIERQVAAYCTTALIGQEGFTSIPDEQFPVVFKRTLEAVHAAIRGDDSDVPF